ncbi:MAG: nitroreductase family protein, partial [Alphaproteobacteria bacterium]|nr:nitroreductase family protein [Alphaproteobacteria bacterium]
MTYCIEQDSLIRRRSVYALGHTRVVTDFCLEDTLKDCLKNCPTPFNAQSARLVLLLNQYHADFWNLVLQKVLAAAPFNKKESVTQKINSFAAAYGTILFFEDLEAMEKLQKDFPLYQKNMHDWTFEANGMLQYMVWQALAENEIGASLQHYNELIEADVKKMLSLPESWKILSQMPFG